MAGSDNDASVEGGSPPSHPPSKGLASVQKQIPEAEVEALRDVAIAAAERIAQKRRYKLAAWVALVTLIVSNAISIPVTLVLAHQSAKSAIRVSRTNGRENCRLIRRIAQAEEQKANSEKPRTLRFEKESKDRLGLTQERFTNLIENLEKEENYRLGIYKEVAKHTCS